MRVIPPLVIDDGNLTSSTAAEPGPGETAWNAATAYTLGQAVYLAANHTRYERLVAGTTATSPELDAVNWLPLGPTNRWAMFDLLRNTGTTAASPLTVVITPGMRVDAIAAVGLVADAVTFTVTVDGDVVFERTEILSTRVTRSWYDYFFGTFSYRAAVAAFDLPPFIDGVVTATFTRATGDVTVGGLILGTSIFLGTTQYEAESGGLNFSTVESDAFGNSVLIQRRNVPTTEQRLHTEKGRVNAVIKVREELNAVPALWSGLDDAQHGYFEALLILGVWTEFTINMAHPDVAVTALKLKEV